MSNIYRFAIYLRAALGNSFKSISQFGCEVITPRWITSVISQIVMITMYRDNARADWRLWSLHTVLSLIVLITMTPKQSQNMKTTNFSKIQYKLNAL